MIRPLRYEIDGLKVKLVFATYEIKCHIEYGRYNRYFLMYRHNSYTDIFPPNANEFVTSIVGYVTAGTCPEIEYDDWPKVLDALCVSRNKGISHFRFNHVTRHVIIRSLDGVEHTLPIREQVHLPTWVSPTNEAIVVDEDDLYSTLDKFQSFWNTYMEHPVPQRIYLLIP